jgi:hypothetical protein
MSVVLSNASPTKGSSAGSVGVTSTADNATSAATGTLTEMLNANTTLTALNCAWNHICKRGATAIGRALAGARGLRELRLAHNWYKPVGTVFVLSVCVCVGGGVFVCACAGLCAGLCAPSADQSVWGVVMFCIM